MSGLAINGDEVHGLAVAGKAFVSDGNQSLIGKKVTGIKRSPDDALVDNWYEAGTSYGSNDDYSINENGHIDHNYASTGTIFGAMQYEGDTYVAVNNASGHPLACDSSRGDGSTHLVWISIKELNIVDD